MADMTHAKLLRKRIGSYLYGGTYFYREFQCKTYHPIVNRFDSTAYLRKQFNVSKG